MYFMDKAYHAGLLISLYFKYWNHTANWAAKETEGYDVNLQNPVGVQMHIISCTWAEDLRLNRSHVQQRADQLPSGLRS
jgi:hypothetical protein